MRPNRARLAGAVTLGIALLALTVACSGSPKSDGAPPSPEPQSKLTHVSAPVDGTSVWGAGGVRSVMVPANAAKVMLASPIIQGRAALVMRGTNCLKGVRIDDIDMAPGDSLIPPTMVALLEPSGSKAQSYGIAFSGGLSDCPLQLSLVTKMTAAQAKNVVGEIHLGADDPEVIVDTPIINGVGELFWAYQGCQPAVGFTITRLSTLGDQPLVRSAKAFQGNGHVNLAADGSTVTGHQALLVDQRGCAGGSVLRFVQP